MKKFIATISYKYGSFISGSSIYGIDAASKSEAKKRANQTAKKRFSGWDEPEVIVTVEGLTTKKARALKQASAQIDEEYYPLARIHSMLSDCGHILRAAKNYDKKKFIATISYKDNYKDAFVGGSSIYGINAASKSEAKERANQIANKRFSNWDEVIITIEELTLKKARALKQAFAQVHEEYQRVAHIHSMLRDCVGTVDGYRNFDN